MSNHSFECLNRKEDKHEQEASYHTGGHRCNDDFRSSLCSKPYRCWLLFPGDGRGLTLKGELALTDVVDLGIDYFGIENAGWADIWASMDLKEFGDALVGALEA